MQAPVTAVIYSSSALLDQCTEISKRSMDQPDDDVSDNESEAYLGDDDGNVGPQDQEVADLDGAEAEGGYESDSEEGQDAGEGQTEVTDNAAHCFREHTDAVFAVAWNPAQPDLVASGGGDDIAYIWKVGQEGFHSLKGHTDSVAALAFNSSGTLLASGSLDSRVSIWESSSGRCVHNLEGPGESVEWVAWHPWGDVILAGSEDFTAWMWNAQSGEMMQVFYGHTGAVRCGRFTPDGKTIVTGGGEGDATLKVWDPKSGTCTGTIQGHGFHTAGLTSVDVSADSTVVITGSEDMTAKISNLHTGKVLGTFQGHTDSLEAVALSSVLPVAATASIDGKVLIWDNATLSVRGTCEHPEGMTGSDMPLRCCMSADAFAFRHEVIKALLASSGMQHPRKSMPSPAVSFRRMPVCLCCYAPSDSTDTQRHKLARYSPPGFMSGLGDLAKCPAVVALCCHSSQPLIFTGCLDGAVRCWDLRTGVCIQTRTGNTKGIQSIALSPDASMVLAGSDDTTARVYGFLNA